MNLSQQVAAVYDSDAMVAFHQLQTLHASEDRLLLRYLTPPATVAVIGCGTGREAFPLAQRGCEVIGLDLAWQMVCAANENQRARDPVSVNFQQGDATRLPYRSASVDHVVMISQVIQHIPQRRNRQQALREIRRVLKPGGYGILSAYNAPVSYLYLLLLLRQHQHWFTGRKHVDPPPRSAAQPMSLNKPFHWLARLRRRIDWELRPTVWSYSASLPVGLHSLFIFVCALTNVQRRFRAKVNHRPHLLEPNDLMLDFPSLKFHLRLSRGNLFMHFPDVDEMREDFDAAGLRLVEYVSLEELQQGRTFSEAQRRKQRLLFYVAQA